MAVALTLNDLRKRQAPDGSIDVVIETLVQSNPILEDVRWAEGNLPTGNQTTQRNGLPEVHLRQINRGVPVGKSSTKQVTDTCCLMESRSEVDVELVSLAPDKEAFRTSEDMAFVEAMGRPWLTTCSTETLQRTWMNSTDWESATISTEGRNTTPLTRSSMPAEQGKANFLPLTLWAGETVPLQAFTQNTAMQD